MSASYILTDIGRGIIRNKISQSEKLILTKVVFGDKSTNLNKEICSKDVELVNPRLSSPIERLYYLRPDNENEILIKLSSVVSELYTDTLEPITIREYGIYDIDDNLIFIGNTNDIYTKIDNDPRDILFDILITLATPVKVIKTVIGQYNCLSPEQKATLENLNTTIVDINNRVIELETCCESMDVTRINDIINSNNQKIEELETELNAGLESLRARLELVENNPGSDTTILVQRIAAIENVINVDLVDIKNRLLDIESNPNTVDLTAIENRLTLLENNSGTGVDLSPIEARLTSLENKPDVDLTPIENRVTNLENNPTIVDLTSINNKLVEIENLVRDSGMIDVTNLSQRVTDLENNFPLDFSPLENKITTLELDTKEVTDDLINRVSELESNPGSSVDLSPIEARLQTLENKPDIDLTPIEDRVSDLEGMLPVDLSGIENRLTILENKPVLDLQYTNLEPTPSAVGGIPAGTVFDNVNIKDIITMLLYPYQKPSFTTFKVNNLTTMTLEVGESFGGNVTFSWTISNNMAIVPNSIMCNGVSDLPNTGSHVQNITPIVKTTATGHTFTITAVTDKGEMIFKNVTFNWRFKRYFGVSPKTVLDDSDILAMPSDFGTTRTRSVDYDCTGGRYIYMVYPTSFGDMSNIRIDNFLWDDFVLVKRSMVNAHGVSIPVNIYRSSNLLNGTVTVNWS